MLLIIIYVYYVQKYNGARLVSCYLSYISKNNNKSTTHDIHNASKQELNDNKNWWRFNLTKITIVFSTLQKEYKITPAISALQQKYKITLAIRA